MAEPLRVLLVEDSEDDALLLLRELRVAGYEPRYERVDSERALLAALESQSWDLVLSDYAMGAFNGMAAFELVKGKGLDLPFIFVSGHIGEERAALAMKQGANDYVLKDNLTRLIPAIRRELKDAEARQQRRQAERALHDRERQLSSIYNTVGDVIFQLEVEPDGRYRFVSVNQTFVAVTGLTMDQVVGKRIDEVVPEPSLTMVLEKYAEAIRDRAIARWEETSDYPTGRLTGEVSVAPIFDDAGKCTHLVGAVHNITARKRAEEELAASKRLLKTVFDALPHTVVVKDAESRYLMVNRAWCETHGVPAEQSVGRHTMDIPGRPEEDKRKAIDEDRELFAAGERQTFQRISTVKSGERRHFHDIRTPLRDEHGAVVGLVGIAVDVTERKRAEEELAASQRLLRTVFDALPHTVVVKDTDSRYLMVNRAWCETYGIPAERAVGRHPTDITGRPEEDKLLGVEEDREVFATGETRRFQRTSVIGTGERRHFYDIRTPLRDERGTVVGLVGISVDLTAEVEARHSADTAYARLHDAIESLSAAFLLFDTEERLVLWNSRVREFFPHLYGRLERGIPYQDILRGEAEQVEPGPDGKEGWLRELQTRLRGPHGVVEVRHKDGHWVQMLERRTSGGGIVALRFDITEFKQREQELRHAQKMETLGQLTGGVAHDFNNLLQIISSYTALSRNELEPDGQRFRDLTVVMGAVDRAAALTQQLLAFSRKQVLQPVPLDLNEVIAVHLKMLRRMLPGSIELEERLVPGLDTVRADRGMVEQVLMNLVVNARDAMPSGGRIAVGTSNSELGAGDCQPAPWARPGRYVTITCSDTGQGMTPEVLEHIFEPFFTTKEQGKGTGLGLSTVYGIVRQHGGLITVESAPRAGTTFRIHLPQRNDHEQAAEGVAQAPLPRGEGTILVAEDAEELRQVAVRLLEAQGYRVLAAADGESAVELFSRHADEISLVVLDVVMPKLNGMEVYRRLQSLKPGIKAVFSSGWYGETDEDLARTEGMRLLSKPYAPEQLLRAVHEVLREHKKR